MRGFVLLCLLHTAFGQITNSWNGPGGGTASSGYHGCASDRSSCGCCLMETQIHRMETFFNLTYGTMKKELKKTHTAIYDMKGSRSVFSVALNNNSVMDCLGPSNDSMAIVYTHVFINLGNGYNMDTGVFTVPRTGVYVLAVTTYARAHNMTTCADLQINGETVSTFREDAESDSEDSGTTYWAKKLMAGDKVSVVLPSGCVICDDNSHYNTFLGFLLYATDKDSEM